MRTLAGADDRIAELERELEATSAAARDRAAIVTEGRTRAAPALADAVRAELEELGMPGAVFEARLLPLDEPGPGGAEQPSCGSRHPRVSPLARSPGPRRAASSPACCWPAGACSPISTRSARSFR